MLFDEAERSRIFNIYKGLSDDLQKICRLMAVIYVPAAVTHITLCLNKAGITSGGGRWANGSVESVLNTELPNDIVSVRTVSRRNYYIINELLAGLLWNESLENGEFARFDAVVDSVMTLNFSTKHFIKVDPSDELRGVRMSSRIIRRELAVGNADDINMACDVICSFYRRVDMDEMLDGIFLDAMMNPIRHESFKLLYSDTAMSVFRILMRATQTDAELYRELMSAVFAWRPLDSDEKENSSRRMLELLINERLIMCGHLDEADSRLKLSDDPQSFALRALIALSRDGDEEGALALYKKGLSMMVKAGEKNPSYESWAGMFYPILLLKHENNSIPARMTAELFFKGKKEWGLIENLQPLAVLVKRMTGTASAADIRKSWVPDGPASSSWFAMPFYLMFRWMGEKHRGWTRAEAMKEVKRLESFGFSFMASELRAIFSSKDAPAHPLVSVMPVKEEWEKALRELDELRLLPPSAFVSGKRVVWELDYTVADDWNVRGISVTPVEQTIRSSGWSKGRHIALKRLATDLGNVEGATEQDVRVASMIRRTEGRYGHEYYLHPLKALTALAGHPLLFRAGSGAPVTVNVSEPTLYVSRCEDGVCMTISPFPLGESGAAVRAEDEFTLSVTPFEISHRRVAEIIGPDGIVVPDSAAEHLLKTMNSLSSVVTIYSDIGDDAAGGVEPDSRIYVRIKPHEFGLAAGAFVRPLGPDGPICRPGSGGTVIYGSIRNSGSGSRGVTRLKTSRDIDAERERLAQFAAVCPVPAEGDAGADWLMPDPETSLEFLEQLRTLGDEVAVEWPQGQSMKLMSSTAGSGNFSFSVSRGKGGRGERRADEWFELTGELRVNENLVLSMKELLNGLRAGSGRFIRLENGEFLALTREFRRRLAELEAVADSREDDKRGGGELRVPMLAAGAVADALGEAASFGEGAEEWRDKVRLCSEAAAMTPEIPKSFCGELRDYQLEGYRWLMRLAHWGGGACLADDMGLGKTIQTLALLAARCGDGPSLIAAPTSVCPNWEDEAARFTPSLCVKTLRGTDREAVLSSLRPSDILIVSYGLLQNEREKLSEIDWNIIVLDEAQAIKNIGTKRSSAVMELRAKFRMATTGTPVENRLAELWSIFRFLNPGYLGSFDRFWERFGAPIERDGDDEARRRLRRMIRPFILRRTKEEVLSELPPKTEITLTVDMKEEEHAFYEALRRSLLEELSPYAEEGAGNGRMQIFAALMKLRRACCSSSMAGAGAAFPSAKLQAFSDLLSEIRAGGHRALVFSQFVDHLSLIREHLDAEGVPYQYLDGSTPSDERRVRVAAFQSGEGDCFLISLRAGGTGLNLTAADYVIHMDPWWNPAVEEQASDRAHRMGQERPVTVYRIITRGTIEEKIVELHAWKRGLADGLLEDAGKAVTLSAEELLELMKD